MTRTEIETRLLQTSRRVSIELLQETLDFMEFIAAKRLYPSLEDKQTWQQDFLSISQWNADEEEMAVHSWKNDHENFINDFFENKVQKNHGSAPKD